MDYYQIIATNGAHRIQIYFQVRDDNTHNQ